LVNQQKKIIIPASTTITKRYQRFQEEKSGMRSFSFISMVWLSSPAAHQSASQQSQAEAHDQADTDIPECNPQYNPDEYERRNANSPSCRHA